MAINTNRAAFLIQKQSRGEIKKTKHQKNVRKVQTTMIEVKLNRESHKTGNAKNIQDMSNFDPGK
jgi:hypothetical protein